MEEKIVMAIRNAVIWRRITSGIESLLLDAVVDAEMGADADEEADFLLEAAVFEEDIEV